MPEFAGAEFFGALLPPELPPWIAAGLIVLSAFTSFLSAAFGIGGGVLLLAVLAALLPPAALIPVHGMVQIGSNAGRAVAMLRYIRLDVIVPFFIGGLIGAAIGGKIVVQLPPWLLSFGMGLFVLWAAWGGDLPGIGRKALFAGGAVSCFLTMFFGATGPFVASLFKALKLDRMSHVGTFAATMTLQHLLKISVFGLLGFNYTPYLPWIVAMIAAGFVGTMLGRRILHGLGDDRFRKVLTWILTLLALRLIWSGVQNLLAG